MVDRATQRTPIEIHSRSVCAHFFKNLKRAQAGSLLCQMKEAGHIGTNPMHPAWGGHLVEVPGVVLLEGFDHTNPLVSVSDPAHIREVLAIGLVR